MTERPTAEFTKVAVEDLYFDTENPRFGGAQKRSTQEQIQELLFRPPHSANLLVDSFVENGFIEYEPLVVRQEGQKFIVIEGNRRLSAVKHIHSNPAQYPREIRSRLERIPVLVFKTRVNAATKSEILTYLGVRHLVGYKEWPAEAKAVFLDQNIKKKSDLNRIIQEFAIRKQDVSRYLVPYRIKKAAQNLIDEYAPSEEQTFWMLGEALSRSGIKDYLELVIDPDDLTVKSFNKDKFRNLLEFLYGASDTDRKGRTKSAKITETRQLTRLANVLASKKASKKLEEGSTLDEAELYVQTAVETIEELIQELRLTLQKVIALKPDADQVKRIGELLRNFEKSQRTV